LSLAIIIYSNIMVRIKEYYQPPKKTGIKNEETTSELLVISRQIETSKIKRAQLKICRTKNTRRNI
jgi:hypothetical protein